MTLSHERRVQVQREAREQKRELHRCPACFAVPPLLYGYCHLTRCPRTFRNVKVLPNGRFALDRRSDRASAGRETRFLEAIRK